jgi:hypothetical protein
MNTLTIAPLPTLPKNLPLDGAIAITVQDGVIPKHKEEATDDIREKGERG